jgi:hypothetical protein
MGKHSKTGHRNQQTTPRGMVEMVDTRTGTAHYLTLTAAKNGLPQGRYTAICVRMCCRGAGRSLLPVVRADPSAEVEDRAKRRPVTSVCPYRSGSEVRNRTITLWREADPVDGTMWCAGWYLRSTPR